MVDIMKYEEVNSLEHDVKQHSIVGGSIPGTLYTVLYRSGGQMKRIFIKFNYHMLHNFSFGLMVNCY